MSDYLYFKQPHVSVRDDGTIVLGWRSAKDDMLTIYFDEDEAYNRPYSGTWIRTSLVNGGIVQDEGELECAADVCKILHDFELAPA